MTVIEHQRFIMALNGQMIGKNGPTRLDDGVLDPLKAVLARDIHELFETTLHEQHQVWAWQTTFLLLSQDLLYSSFLLLLLLQQRRQMRLGTCIGLAA
jgi:hypothetical protein